jgi:hypothetical protein
VLVAKFFSNAIDRFTVFPVQPSIINRNDHGRSQQYWICADADRGGTFLMKIASSMWTKGTLAGLLAGCFIFGAALPARAGLGANATSVDSDAAAMQATMSPPTTATGATGSLSQSAAFGHAATSSPSAAYDVKSFVTPSGVTVREYVGPSGTVFGIGWDGHRPPNLSVLLGSYYREYASAAAASRHNDLRRSKTVGPNTVVVMAGHMGRLTGHAYVPGLVPSGLDAKAVVK